MKEQIRIVILSDHKFLREDLAEYLEYQVRCTSILTYPTTWDPVEIVRQVQPSHIIICVPEEITDQFCSQIERLANNETLHILALIDQQKPNELANLLLAGVNGFVTEDDWQNQLFKSIEIVSNDGISLPPPLVRTIFNFLRNPIVSEKSKHLTSKEIQVLKEVRKGLSYKELADHFNIGECTIRTHCKSIYRKLGVRGRIEAINTVFLNPGLQISTQ